MPQLAVVDVERFRKERQSIPIAICSCPAHKLLIESDIFEHPVSVQRNESMCAEGPCVKPGCSYVHSKLASLRIPAGKGKD